jgi:hypothetical protein
MENKNRGQTPISHPSTSKEDIDYTVAALEELYSNKLGVIRFVPCRLFFFLHSVNHQQFSYADKTKTGPQKEYLSMVSP